VLLSAWAISWPAACWIGPARRGGRGRRQGAHRQQYLLGGERDRDAGGGRPVGFIHSASPLGRFRR
jgi:hypothetical protein